MRLSKRPQNFSYFFVAVLGSILNFECSEKKSEPDRLSICEFIDSKRCA